MGIQPTKHRVTPAPPPKPGGWDDPETLRAYYRQRSESLNNSHTTQRQTAQMVDHSKDGQQAANGMRPTQTWIEYVISALAGHPGSTQAN